MLETDPFKGVGGRDSLWRELEVGLGWGAIRPGAARGPNRLVVSESRKRGQKKRANTVANRLHRGAFCGELWRGCGVDGADCRIQGRQ